MSLPSITASLPSPPVETESEPQRFMSKISSSQRPPFNTHLTADRLREATEAHKSPFVMISKIRKGRTSIFKEVGLDDNKRDSIHHSISGTLPLQSTQSEYSPHSEAKLIHEDEKRFGEITGLKFQPPTSKGANNSQPDNQLLKRQRQNSLPSRWYAKLAYPRARPRVQSTSATPPASMASATRLALLAMLVALVIPTFSLHSGWSTGILQGANAGPVTRRESSSTDICARWAQQVAFVNGTLYMYGGRSKTDEGQEDNTWNNDFLSLDMTKDWDRDSAPLEGLTLPDGPPSVALGYLWHDYHNLFLYGGQFSDTPYVDPGPESVWRYSISDQTWTEITNPLTSAGNFSEPAGQPVHRAAEGAGISVPELGLSWYFGGHLDWATTPGWSTQTKRVYLKSLIEFTHPGYVNSGVNELSTGTGAGENGAFRNITQGGVQADDFPERADGALVFVPGWGAQGVLIGLAGGTENSFTPDLKVLDVYDIANSKWFHQETSGDIPEVRVNPCAVVAGASDASSFQVYMFGGQNLQPYKDQTQYDDMYVLTIPSFTWLKVDQSDQSSVPSPRAGHTCTMQDGQMIVVGGFSGLGSACDSPGVYIFDASTLQWKDDFKAGDHSAEYHPDNFILAGSYGYSVPNAVQRVIGGDSGGSATVTTPAVGPATGGPFATGHAPVYTVTQGGPTATITSPPDSGSRGDSDHVSPGLIAAGVIAGIFGLLALYLGFCAWLYRRQVKAYRQHLAVVNRYSGTMSPGAVALLGTADGAAGTTAGAAAAAGRPRSTKQSSRTSDETYGWVGSSSDGRYLAEPKWMSSSEDPSPGSGFTASSGAKRSQERPATSGSNNSSAENLLDGQEPSFFSVVMGPRRALRVVNNQD